MHRSCSTPPPSWPPLLAAIVDQPPQPCPHCLTTSEEPLIHSVLECPATTALRNETPLRITYEEAGKTLST